MTDLLEELAAWQVAVLALYGAVVLLSFWRQWFVTNELRAITFLSPNGPGIDSADPPLVSIMVPAKDEEQTIERCVRSLLNQDYPNLEVLVVDDRSEDSTADIVRQLAEEDDRLRLVRIDKLPTGWTGKTHALHRGREYADGEWLLYVDADTQLHPRCLSVTLRDCIDHQADMQSLVLRLESNSFWENVIQPFAGTCLVILYPLSKVNDRACADHGFANGQFILVRGDAMDELGGHEAVRDKFVEDIHLGRRVRQHGMALRLAMGRDVANVRMYADLNTTMRGWSRIFYAAVDSQSGRLWGLILLLTVFSITPYIAIATGVIAAMLGVLNPFLSCLMWLGIVHEANQLVVYARSYRASGSDRRYLAFRWLSVGTMIAILFKTIRLCRSHEVEWRGTRYTEAIRQPAKLSHDVESA